MNRTSKQVLLKPSTSLNENENSAPLSGGKAPASRLHLPGQTRRGLLAGLGSTGLLSGYALQVEPHWRLDVRHYAVTPPNWLAGRHLTIAALADLHVYEPSLSLERTAEIVEATNLLRPDLVVLLGDYGVSADHPERVYSSSDIGAVLGGTARAAWCFRHRRQPRLVERQNGDVKPPRASRGPARLGGKRHSGVGECCSATRASR